MTHIEQPFTLRTLDLPSRLVRSATAEHILVDSEGGGERLGEIYRRLGEGGVGLIVTGHVAAHPTGHFSKLMPGCYTDAQEAGWREAFAAAHETPAKIVMQINHAGGRAPRGDIGREPWCVSRIEAKRDGMEGDELDEARIAEVIGAFADAAERAMHAGADGVQLHGAHGYLVSQFFSPRANRRDDRWGGSLENRSRFALEMARAVRERLGPDAVIGIKLGAADSEVAGEPVLTVDETLEVARQLERDAVDFVEVSGAFHNDVVKRRVRRREDEAYYLPWARRFKEALTVPVIAVGGFRSLDVVEDALVSGACDLVSMSRPLIRQPDLLRELVGGVGSTCASDNRCLLRRDEPLHCPVQRKENNRTSEE